MIVLFTVTMIEMRVRTKVQPMIDKIDDRPDSTNEYSKLNVVQMSKTMQLDDNNNRFMKQFKASCQIR